MLIASIFCSVLSGACELGGLWLVVVGIRDDQRRARTLFDKPITFQRPQRSYPTRRSASTPGGRTTWGSLQNINEQLRALETSVHNVLVAMRKGLDEQDDRIAEALHKAQVEGDNELRQRLRDVLTGSLTGRAWGAVLLAAGIALGVAGSVLSNFS